MIARPPNFPTKLARNITHAFQFLCLATVVTPALFAQLYSGSLGGVVTDPTGAVVPGAKITLIDMTKGYSFGASADSMGHYVLRNLPPSTYKLTVEGQNFKTYTREDITLDVNQNATADVTLELGATTQTVEVQGSAPVLSTQDAVTGQVLNRTFINDLPLISRSVFNLAFLSPGVSQPAGSSFGLNSASNNFISNGGRNATADILIDGVSTTNYEQNSGIQLALYTPSVDAVQEFKLQQNNFSAEVGFSGATVINVVTRSGTNNFHGSLYEFHRNSSLNANDWFKNANGVAISPSRLNQFGGTVGGPIRKDRMFFFFDYEGTRNQSSNTKRAGVPSAAERTGDFGELCGFAGGTFDASGKCSAAKGQLWDPFTGVFVGGTQGTLRSSFIPFNSLAVYQSPGNSKLNGTPFQLPARPGNLIDPVAFKMMKFYPLPNVAVGTPAYNRLNNWIGSGGSVGTNNKYDIKIDHRFSERDWLSGKYSWGHSTGHGVNCFGNVADPCTQGPNSGGPHVFALNHTHTFNPTTLLNLSYGVARSFTFTRGIAADFPDYDPVKDLGLPAYIKSSGIIATPAIVIQDGYQQVGGNDSLGSQAWSLLKYGQETHHLMSSLNRMQGRHELKFGGEMRVHRINFLQSGVPEGIYRYNFSSTSQASSQSSTGGDALASFLVGGPGSSGQYEVPVSVSTQNFQYAAYFQDNWRVTEKLTLNLGMRYDIDLPRTERYNRMSWVDPDVPSPLQVPGLPKLRGGLMFASPDQRSPYDANYTSFGPRVGLAYRLRSKTVLRSGYGIFYEPSKAGSAGTGAGGFAGFNWNTNWLTTFQGDRATPWGRISDPFPITGPQLPPGSSLGLLTGAGQGIGGPIRTWNAAPYMQTWSLGIQHELPGGVLVDAAYVGTKGTHLYFAGAGGLNFLGADIERLSPAQIAALTANVANPFFGIITDPTSSLSGKTVSASQLLRPYPQFTGLGGNDPPWANSIYHAFQLRAEKRLSRGLQFLVTYTNSKSIDDASVSGGNVTWLGGSVNFQDPNRRDLERAISQFDISQVFQFSYVYQLPWGRGKRWGSTWNPWLDTVLGGWQTNGIWRFDTGQPIALGLSGPTNIPTYGDQRPNLIGPLTRSNGPNFRDQYFASPENAKLPPQFTVGTAPRVLPNVRIPGTRTAALSLFKEIPLGRLREGTRLEYRIEAFNALNHPQFKGPNTTVNTSSFGRVTEQANSPRELQMALKLYW